MTDDRIQAEILSDTNSNGTERPWKERKDQSLNVSEVLTWGDAYDCVSEKEYDETWLTVIKDGEKNCEKNEKPFEHIRLMRKSPVSEFARVLDDHARYRELKGWLGKKSENVYECGETLEFALDADGNKRLFQAWFCKDRLCPMCNWRRSVKLRGQVLKILEAMEERKIEGLPIFLTLTMPNVKADGISKSFSDFAKGFKRLTDYKEVKAVVVGAIRCSEITYNSKRDDYHVHIHCLVWVIPNYFSGHNYISQARWTTLWERAVKWVPAEHPNKKTGKSTHLVVHVERVKPKDYDKALEPTEVERLSGDNLIQKKYINAVLELTKYTTKPTSIPYVDGMPYQMTDKQKMKAGARLSALERGLYRKRLIGFFGIFKELHRELNLDDTEDGDLIGADEAADGTASEVVRYTYNYAKKNYFKTGHGNIDQNGYAHYEEDD